MYKAINRFKEEIHDNHIYEVNDPYPAEGKPLDKKRAEFLTKIHPEYRVAFLAYEEPPKDEKKEESSAPKTTTRRTASKTTKAAAKSETGGG